MQTRVSAKRKPTVMSGLSRKSPTVAPRGLVSTEGAQKQGGARDRRPIILRQPGREAGCEHHRAAAINRVRWNPPSNLQARCRASGEKT